MGAKCIINQVYCSFEVGVLGLKFFELAKPLLPPKQRAVMSFFGTDESEWKDALLKHVPAHILPRKYGGTSEFEIPQPNST